MQYLLMDKVEVLTMVVTWASSAAPPRLDRSPELGRGRGDRFDRAYEPARLVLVGRLLGLRWIFLLMRRARDRSRRILLWRGRVLRNLRWRGRVLRNLSRSPGLSVRVAKPCILALRVFWAVVPRDQSRRRRRRRQTSAPSPSCRAQALQQALLCSARSFTRRWFWLSAS